MLLSRIFDDQHRGFYVDVGAHHPTRYSNTHLLYRRGWSGINIDPTPGVKASFDRKRPRDINLELAISDKPGTATLFLFDDTALNSIVPELSDQRDSETSYSRTGQIEVETMSLAAALSQHVPHQLGVIDLLSIDVEGSDLSVLRSNDWDRFRPRVVVMEALESSLDLVLESVEYEFLTNLRYSLHSKLVNSVVYRDTDPIDI